MKVHCICHVTLSLLMASAAIYSAQASELVVEDTLTSSIDSIIVSPDTTITTDVTSGPTTGPTTTTSTSTQVRMPSGQAFSHGGYDGFSLGSSLPDIAVPTAPATLNQAARNQWSATMSWGVYGPTVYHGGTMTQQNVSSYNSPTSGFTMPSSTTTTTNSTVDMDSAVGITTKRTRIRN